MADAMRGVELLFTSDPASRDLALSEVLDAAPGSRFLRWLAPDVGRVALGMSWASLAGTFREAPPVFCRHVCPVEMTVPLSRSDEDLQVLAEAAARFVDRLDPQDAFSVQTRTMGSGWPYGPFDVNTRAADVLARSGARLDVRDPVQVLSIVLAQDHGYLGLSYAADNLSDWAGGARRFKRDPRQISRAEFKLLEAMELFGLDSGGARRALDLGAAPGGWTRVLRQHDVHVVAVDPADLAPALRTDPGVRHVRELAQDYLPTVETPFDVILNDMRMDARDSARTMNVAAHHLRPSGWAVMTLKLPKRGTEPTMNAALAVLRRSYDVLGVRQLFHNRSEVTAALRTRSYVSG